MQTAEVPVEGRVCPSFARLSLTLLVILLVGICSRFVEIYTLAFPQGGRVSTGTSYFSRNAREGCLKPRNFGDTIRKLPRRYVLVYRYTPSTFCDKT